MSKFVPGIYGGIDCGTGSIRLMIISVTDDGCSEVLIHKTVKHNLRYDLHEDGIIKNNTIEQLVEINQDFAKISNTYQTKLINAAATESLRSAKNSAEVLGALTKAGIDYTIIDGINELEASILGASNSLNNMSEHFYFVDSGGSSTEFSLVQNSNFKPIAGDSLRIGVVPLSKELEAKGDKTSPADIEKMTSSLTNIFTDTKQGWPKVPSKINEVVIASTTMSRFCFLQKGLGHGKMRYGEYYDLSLDDLHTILKNMSDMTLPERIKNPDLNEDIAHYILPTIIQSIAILNATGARTARFIQNSVCRGLALQAAIKKDKASNG